LNEDSDAVGLFMSVLGVTELMATHLTRTGFTSIEEIAYVPIDELLQTSGVERHIPVNLREKARAHLAV
jgi:transcription termination/antitermination protein NusA